MILHIAETNRHKYAICGDAGVTTSMIYYLQTPDATQYLVGNPDTKFEDWCEVCLNSDVLAMFLLGEYA